MTGTMENAWKDVGESVLVYGVPETRVSFESQFIL